MSRGADGRDDRRRWLRYLMGAVLAWGSLLALGALLYGFDPARGDVRFAPNLWRGLIVESCVLAFVGVWWLLARRR